MIELFGLGFCSLSIGLVLSFVSSSCDYPFVFDVDIKVNSIKLMWLSLNWLKKLFDGNSVWLSDDWSSFF